MTEDQIKAATDRANAEQDKNIREAKNWFEAYYAGSASASYLLRCKHGAVRKVRV